MSNGTQSPGSIASSDQSAPTKAVRGNEPPPMPPLSDTEDTDLMHFGSNLAYYHAAVETLPLEDEGWEEENYASILSSYMHSIGQTMKIQGAFVAQLGQQLSAQSTIPEMIPIVVRAYGSGCRDYFKVHSELLSSKMSVLEVRKNGSSFVASLFSGGTKPPEMVMKDTEDIDEEEPTNKQRWEEWIGEAKVLEEAKRDFDEKMQQMEGDPAVHIDDLESIRKWNEFKSSFNESWEKLGPFLEEILYPPTGAVAEVREENKGDEQ